MGSPSKEGKVRLEVDKTDFNLLIFFASWLNIFVSNNYVSKKLDEAKLPRNLEDAKMRPTDWQKIEILNKERKKRRKKERKTDKKLKF